MHTLAAPIEIHRPQSLEFGVGTAGHLGRWAAEGGYHRILVITGRSGASRLDDLRLRGKVSLFADVRPEPDSANLQQALAVAEEMQPQLIVGFGGGSVMDIAKLVAVLAGSKQTLGEIVGAHKVAAPRSIALAQVPTTAGTGSEAGSRALVVDTATGAKLAVESLHMLADMAIIDPLLTLTMPPAATAATGIDALAHCVEAFTNRRAHPMIDLYALEGARLIGQSLARAVADGSDVGARAALSLASLYGGYCLGPVNTAGGHALAYPLGTRWSVGHGAANALIFPHVLAFNAPERPEKTGLVMEALNLPGSPDPSAILERAFRFCADLGVEMRLSGHGVGEGDLDSMAEEAFGIRRLLDNNPRELTREAIRTIYDAAL